MPLTQGWQKQTALPLLEEGLVDCAELLYTASFSIAVIAASATSRWDLNFWKARVTQIQLIAQFDKWPRPISISLYNLNHFPELDNPGQHIQNGNCRKQDMASQTPPRISASWQQIWGGAIFLKGTNLWSKTGKDIFHNVPQQYNFKNAPNALFPENFKGLSLKFTLSLALQLAMRSSSQLHSRVNKVDNFSSKSFPLTVVTLMQGPKHQQDHWFLFTLSTGYNYWFWGFQLLIQCTFLDDFVTVTAL